MTLAQPYEHAWRARAAFVSSKLDRAHSSVYFLGDALENGGYPVRSWPVGFGASSSRLGREGGEVTMMETAVLVSVL